VRTSNPSAAELQDLTVVDEDGGSSRLWQRTARLVRGWAADHIGACGYSSVGAVGGGTTPDVLARVRSEVPTSIILVPGFGVQGATAADVVGAFDSRGEGAVVNASRSIVFANREAQTVEELARAAGDAARLMRDQLREALARRAP
jgi:orotidine-5'-phosphate decarboxylase